MIGIAWGTKCSFGCFGCAFEGGQPDEPRDTNVVIGQELHWNYTMEDEAPLTQSFTNKIGHFPACAWHIGLRSGEARNLRLVFLCTWLHKKIQLSCGRHGAAGLVEEDEEGLSNACLSQGWVDIS